MDGSRTTNLIFATARGTLAALLVLLAVIIGLGYGAWWLMSQVGETTAQIWALLATLAVPASFWVGHRIGTGKTNTWLASMTQSPSSSTLPIHAPSTRSSGPSPRALA